MNTEALKALVDKVDGDLAAMIEMLLDGEGLVTRAELIECLIAKGESALKSAASVAQWRDTDDDGITAEHIADCHEVHAHTIAALEALNVSPEERAAAIAADAARPPMTPATPEQIAEALAFMQQSDDPAIKNMADYAVNLHKLTESSNEGTRH